MKNAKPQFLAHLSAKACKSSGRLEAVVQTTCDTSAFLFFPPPQTASVDQIWKKILLLLCLSCLTFFQRHIFSELFSCNTRSLWPGCLKPEKQKSTSSNFKHGTHLLMYGGLVWCSSFLPSKQKVNIIALWYYFFPFSVFSGHVASIYKILESFLDIDSLVLRKDRLHRD